MINLTELKAFVAVARFGSFTRASEHLNLSQPALSRRISLLENAIGSALFDRFRNGVQLTDAGRGFLPHAEAALASIQDGVETARGAAQGETGQIVLAIAGSLCSVRVIEKLGEFRRKHAGIELSILAGTSTEVSELVLRSEANLGLRYRVDTNRRLHSDPIGTERLVLVCSPTHPLAGLKSVSRTQLADETWIAFPARPSDPLESLRGIFKEHGLSGKRAMVIDNTIAQKRFIEAGFGIGLLPYGSVQEEIGRGSLHVLNIKSMRTSVPVALVHRKGTYIGKIAQSLAAMLVPVFSRK